MDITDAMLEVIHTSRELAVEDELKDAEELIRKTADLDSAARDTLAGIYERGPLWAGDLPSKMGQGVLLRQGFAVQVVMKGEDGYTACTYDGQSAYKLLKSGLMPSAPRRT